MCTMATRPGLMPPFDTARPQDWSAWVLGVKSALAFYEVTDDARKRGFLLASCGTAVVSLAECLLSPTDLDACSFDQIVKAVHDHYAPKPSEMTCRLAFYNRSQLARETVADFLAALRHLASDCKFGANLDEALRDRFIVGLREEKLKQRIIEAETVTLASALSTAIAWENNGDQTPAPCH